MLKVEAGLVSSSGVMGTATQDDRQLAATIASAVQHSYASLPKTGKPQPHEFTVLAGIAAYCNTTENASNCNSISSNFSDDSSQPQAAPVRPAVHVVALGTGTKCLGGSSRSRFGEVLHDSHAEVIARRAFVAWVYHQLELALQQQLQQAAPAPAGTEPSLSAAAPSQPAGHTTHQAAQSAFVWYPDSGRFALRPGIHWAMYVSQSPCGDASIFEQAGASPCTTAAAAAAPVGKIDGGSSGQCRQDEGPPAGQQAHNGSVTLTHSQQQQQQQQPTSGRTGAKLLKPAGAVDVADAVAVAAATAAGGANAVAGCPAGTGPAQKQPPQQPQQQQQQQQQKLHGSVHVPGAADVECGPQQLGVLRRKPGKGDPTLSLSCSDKLARWACLGLQGSLLCGLLEQPLYLTLLVVSGPPSSSSAEGSAAAPGTQAAGQQQPGQQAGQQQQQQCGQQCFAALEAAGRRAFGVRLAGCAAVLPPPFQLVAPRVVAVAAAGSELGLWPDGQRKVPAGTSVNWTCQQPLMQALTATNRKGGAISGVSEATLSAFGIKAGSARKGPAANAGKARSRICSAALMESWRHIAAVVQHQQQAKACSRDDAAEQQEYAAAKQANACQQYQHVWRALRQSVDLFCLWLSKSTPQQAGSS